jgi:hypothetical protein
MFLLSHDGHVLDNYCGERLLMSKSRYVPDFDDEHEFRDWLEQQFIDEGWQTETEVNPNSSRLRADLIVRNQEYGPIGIECKYMPSPKAGRKVGQALEQIVQRYRGKTYGAHTVDLWAFAPYFYKGGTVGTQTIRELLCHFGIGIIRTDKARIKIDFSHSDRDKKILLKDFFLERKAEEHGDDNAPDGVGTDYGDIDRIEDSVQKKIGRLDSEYIPECQHNNRNTGCTADAHDTVEIDSYEIHLCKYHIRKFDREQVANLKQHLQEIEQLSD